jgi:mannosyltransferase
VARSSTWVDQTGHSLWRRAWLALASLSVSPIPSLVLLGAIFVAAAWLRLTALDRQSLWFDEADAVIRAQSDLMTVLRTFIQPGENGPLYHLLLHFWIDVAGASEKAVRLPSAVAGLLTIPLMYLVGLRTLGQRAGLLAAGLLAISPYHVWYSQEAKMYSMAVLLTLLSTALLIESLRRNERRWWAGYVIVTTLGFYFHVTTVLIFGAHCAFVLLTWRKWPGRQRPWLISVALLTLPYLPIALWAGRVVLGAAVTWHAHVSFWEMARITVTKFAANRADLVTEQRATWLYAILAGTGLLGGVLAAWHERVRPSARAAIGAGAGRWLLLFACLVLLPLVGFYFLTLRQPLFNDRYLIMALPAYLLLAAGGLRLLERRLWPLALVALVLVLAFAWVPLRDVNRTTATQKEDWRPAYGLIAQHARPDDLILVHPGYLVTTYHYYAQHIAGLSEIEVSTIPSFRVEGFDEHQMALFVREDAPGERVWLVQSPDRVPAEDPNHALEDWLARSGAPLHVQVLNGVIVTLYALPPPELDPPPV